MMAALAALSLASCSDDIVCPEDTLIVAPAITASVVESRLAEGDRTSVSVRCVATPLPDEYVVFVSYQRLWDIEVETPLALVATLDTTSIVWQHGVGCTLRVNIDTEFATATEVVPGAFEVEPPADIALGDTLRLSWTSADDADYYTARCIIRDARGDSLVLVRSVADTTVTWIPDEVEMAGMASGWVQASTGPFTDGGTDGNITGEGWGFFTVSYYDTLCLFDFEVNTAPAH